MTRQEQIEEEIKKQSAKYGSNDSWANGFEDGAEWADANPEPNKAKTIVMNSEFVKKFFGNAYQTNSYPPSLVEELCLSHETLRQRLAIAVEALKFIAEHGHCDNEGVIENHKDCPDHAREALAKIEELKK